MMIDIHAKNQLNICKRLGKIAQNCLLAEILPKKEFADYNFKSYENGEKLSKWVGNTVGKEEIACYQQFLLFPQCF